MKIDSTRSTPLGQSALRSQKSATGTPAAVGEAASQVHLTATDPGSAPVDPARVAEIRQAIGEGRLKIDAERIADRLIEATRENLAREGKS